MILLLLQGKYLKPENYINSQSYDQNSGINSVAYFF